MDHCVLLALLKSFKTAIAEQNAHSADTMGVLSLFPNNNSTKFSGPSAISVPGNYSIQRARPNLQSMN